MFNILYLKKKVVSRLYATKSLMYTIGMRKIIIHSVALMISVMVAFVLPKSRLIDYQFQFVAFLFILLYIKKRFIPAAEKSYRGESRLLESVSFTLIIVTIINTTGGTLSPYFFLIYFLLFSISLILDPKIAFVVTLTLTALYLVDAPRGINFSYYIPIFSLVFLTPFTVYLGDSYLKNEDLRKRGEMLKDRLTRTREDTFLFLSLMLKNNLKNISAALENFNGDNELSKIRHATNKMEKLIDKFEEEI